MKSFGNWKAKVQDFKLDGLHKLEMLAVTVVVNRWTVFRNRFIKK